MASTVPMSIVFLVQWSGGRGLLRALPRQSDALVEHVDRDISLVFGHHQRRRDADRARTAAQKQDAALKGQFDDAIALVRSILPGLLVLHDLHADHQTASADIADQFVFAWPVGHALKHVTA